MIFNKFNIKLSIFWVLSFFIIILMMSFTVNAASVSGPQLPILVENVNVQEYQDYFNSYYNGFFDLYQNNVIGWGSIEDGHFRQTFAIPQVPDQVQNYLTFSPGNLSSVYPDFDYNNNTLTLTFSGLSNDNFSPWRIITFAYNGVFFNTASTLNKGVYGNTGSNINYISSDIYLTNNGAWVVNQPVFVTELPITPADIGVAIIPDGLFTPDLSDIVPPNKVPPSYTPSDYTWTPKPSIDNSSSDALLKSIFGIIEWGMENINGEFHILKNNLNGWFKYLGDLLTYYLNGIVESINAGIQNFYENMANLVQPIYDMFSYITEPLDLDEVETALSSSTTYSLVSVGSTFMNTFKNYFDNISTPDILRFHIPYTILTKTGYIDFDFGWYAGIRDSVLPWIVGFLYAGFGLAFFRSIPSIIHGVSGILQKGG